MEFLQPPSPSTRMTVGAAGSGGLAGIHQPATSMPGSRLGNFTVS